MMEQKNQLVKNLAAILEKNFLIAPENFSDNTYAIIYDQESSLSVLLTDGYQGLLPAAKLLAFYDHSFEKVEEFINELETGTLVILIESSSFRMSNFRWRLELFNRGLQVIEHAHLGANSEDQIDNYIDTLADQNDNFQIVSGKMEKLIQDAREIKIRSGPGIELVYGGQMEASKNNIGDFRKMKNKGCAFPIGEIFTEPRNLKAVNGEALIYAFAATNHQVVFCEKAFPIRVREGAIVWDDAFPDEFKITFELLRSENNTKTVPLRELGFGLNQGISPQKRLNDISAFERVCGVHISLGMKHDIYRDKIEKDIAQRYHIDIFPVTNAIEIDGEKVFAEGKYLFRWLF